MRLYTSLTLVAAVALSACTHTPASRTSAAANAHSPATVLNGKLVGPNQMTLYVFDRDTAGSGKSVCNGNCATNWPPLVAPAGARPIGNWSVVTRDDGTPQWAYQGKPVYYWAKDSKPGDATGHGVGNAWRIATP
ncbi:MAG: hypothetical protein Q4B46_06655 [Comamonadaceae bacterium]|nr:hypothetical protein [Comamonadaceae bacterium]